MPWEAQKENHWHLHKEPRFDAQLVEFFSHLFPTQLVVISSLQAVPPLSLSLEELDPSKLGMDFQLQESSKTSLFPWA